MGIKRNIVIVLFSVVILIIGACLLYVNTNTVQEDVPTDIASFYEQYLYLYKTGTYADVDPFLHFELSESRKLNEELFKNIQSFQIQKWEKINNNLWMVSTYIEIDDALGPRMGYHFVGNVDGNLKVMLGKNNVPKVLSGNDDLSKRYTIENSLPMDSVVYPIN